MRYLQMLNVALLLLGAAMAVNLGVVCLLYWVHVESEPRIAADLPRLYALTALFTALALAAALPFLGHRRGWSTRWLLQGLPVLPLVGLLAFITGLRR